MKKIAKTTSAAIAFYAALVSYAEVSTPVHAAENDIAKKIAAAKPGATVQLPAGSFAAGNIAVPPGVNLKGAGYAKTILDAAGFDAGLIIKGKDSAISDLTVQNSRGTGISAANTSGVKVQRVRLIGNLNGAIFDHVENGRIENSIAARNRIGVALAHCVNSVVVNCTIAGSTALAISLAGDQKTAVFNNLTQVAPSRKTTAQAVG